MIVLVMKMLKIQSVSIILFHCNNINSSLHTYCSLGETDYANYISSLSSSALLHMDLLLDWDSQGVDNDLNEIAHHMIHWEEDLSSSLKLTKVDIHDVTRKHPYNPELQRCAIFNPSIIN